MEAIAASRMTIRRLRSEVGAAGCTQPTLGGAAYTRQRGQDDRWAPGAAPQVCTAADKQDTQRLRGADRQRFCGGIPGGRPPGASTALTAARRGPPAVLRGAQCYSLLDLSTETG